MRYRMDQQMNEAISSLTNVKVSIEMMTTMALKAAHLTPKVVESAIAMMLAADLSVVNVCEAEEEVT